MRVGSAAGSPAALPSVFSGPGQHDRAGVPSSLPRRSHVRGGTRGLIRWSSEIGPPVRVRPVTENHRPEAPFPAIRPSHSAAESRWEHAQTCGRLSLAQSATQGPVEQFGVLATLSRWRPRVQIPSGPRWLGSSVGTSDRLKSDRSPVRPRPQPPATPVEILGGGFALPVRIAFLPAGHPRRPSLWPAATDAVRRPVAPRRRRRDERHRPARSRPRTTARPGPRRTAEHPA